jgi:molecular chaperone GrpE
VQGIAAIDRKLRTLLDSEGVVPIEALGLPFDPHLHEALQQVETTEVPDETVILEIQRGYRIRDRVLRPSLVAVARNPGEAAAAPGSAPQGGSRSPGSLPSHTDHPTDTDPGPAAGHDQPGADAGSGGND